MENRCGLPQLKGDHAQVLMRRRAVAQPRASNVDFRHQQRSGPRRRAMAFAGLHRRRCLPVLSGRRRHHAAGLGYAVADQDRALDPRTPRDALHRHLFVHARRRGVDLELLAVASPVRAGLRAIELVGRGHPDIARDRRDRGDLRSPARALSGAGARFRARDPAPLHVDGSFSRAPAHAGAARHGGLRRRAAGGRRSA